MDLIYASVNQSIHKTICTNVTTTVQKDTSINLLQLNQIDKRLGPVWTLEQSRIKKNP